MSIAHALENYLGEASVNYNVVSHSHTESAYDSACSAHVPTASVVKAVLLRNREDGRYLMALIPASNKLRLPWVRQKLASDLVLAREAELSAMFPDCMLGAIPGFGQAYDVDLIWDIALVEQAQLFFEAGDHEGLISINQSQFRSLFDRHLHCAISLPDECYALYHSEETRGGLH